MNMNMNKNANTSTNEHEHERENGQEHEHEKEHEHIHEHMYNFMYSDCISKLPASECFFCNRPFKNPRTIYESAGDYIYKTAQGRLYF